MTSVSPIGASGLTAINGDPTASQFVNAAALDTDLQTLRAKIDAVNAATSVMIRDDNLLVDSAVRLRSLNPEVIALLGSGAGNTGIVWQPKAAVACASTGNLTLSGEQTIDGVVTSASRILVKDQTLGQNNGIYVTAAGAWSRATDCDTASEIGYALCYVSAGTTNGGRSYINTAAGAVITLGTTALVFAQLPGAGVPSVATIAQGGTGQTSPQKWPTIFRRAARAVSVAALTVASPGATIDGVTMVAGDRVLLTAQATGSQNGLWVWNSAITPMTRPVDYAAADAVMAYADVEVPINEGTLYGGSIFRLTTTGTITIDTTTTVWSLISVANVALPATIVFTIDTIAALKALAAPLTGITYLVRGYYSVSDGGGGLFRWNSADATTDNAGTVIALNLGGTGRFNRLLTANESMNVRWFGALGDGATDDTASFHAARTAAVSGGYGAISVPPGAYRVNLVWTSKVDIIGAGAQASVLASYTVGGWALTLTDRDASWRFALISDVRFGSYTASDNGVRYGGDTYVTNDEFTGRWIYDHVIFEANVGVYKQAGNIGNRFVSCQFMGGGTYGVYAYKRAGGGTMHSGADSFIACHFEGFTKAAYFANSGADGSSNLAFENCIFESNPGFAIFIYNWASAFAPGVLLDSIFQEFNGTGGTIALHVGATGLAGATTNYAAQNFYFRNVHQGRIRETQITTWTLENSVIVCDRVATGDGGDVVTKDAASALIVESVATDLSTSLSYFADNVTLATRQPNGGAGCSVIITKPRTHCSRRWAANLLLSETFDEPAGQTLGGVSVPPVADGTVFDICGEWTAPDALRHTFLNTVIATNKYFVLTLDVALQSGTITEFGIYGATVVARIDGTNLTAGRWFTICIVSDSIGITAPDVSWQLTMSNGAKIRFGGYQVHTFDKRQDAVEFQRSGIFTPPSARRLTGFKTYDPANLADGAGVTTTVTVTGAALGDFAAATFSLDLQSIMLTAWVSAADTVSVRFQNESGGAIDLASGTLTARVIR